MGNELSKPGLRTINSKACSLLGAGGRVGGEAPPPSQPWVPVMGGTAVHTPSHSMREVVLPTPISQTGYRGPGHRDGEHQSKTPATSVHLPSQAHNRSSCRAETKHGLRGGLFQRSHETHHQLGSEAVRCTQAPRHPHTPRPVGGDCPWPPRGPPLSVSPFATTVWPLMWSCLTAAAGPCPAPTPESALLGQHPPKAAC